MQNLSTARIQKQLKVKLLNLILIKTALKFLKGFRFPIFNFTKNYKTAIHLSFTIC